jgi:hypothetical protein
MNAMIERVILLVVVTENCWHVELQKEVSGLRRGEQPLLYGLTLRLLRVIHLNKKVL